MQTLGDEESVGVGGDIGGDGILSVAKLKYRAKVCTLDNADARASARALARPRTALSATVNIEIRKL